MALLTEIGENGWTIFGAKAAAAKVARRTIDHPTPGVLKGLKPVSRGRTVRPSTANRRLVLENSARRSQAARALTAVDRRPRMVARPITTVKHVPIPGTRSTPPAFGSGPVVKRIPINARRITPSAPRSSFGPAGFGVRRPSTATTAAERAVAEDTAKRVKLGENPIAWAKKHKVATGMGAGALFAGGNAMKGFGGPPTGKSSNPTQQARGIYGF